MFPALNVILRMPAALACLEKFYTEQKGAGGAYLEQSSQAMFPEVSLMVRSETNAGYSVSQGSRVCFNFWAVGVRKKKKNDKAYKAQALLWLAAHSNSERSSAPAALWFF